MFRRSQLPEKYRKFKRMKRAKVKLYIHDLDNKTKCEIYFVIGEKMNLLT